MATPDLGRTGRDLPNLPLCGFSTAPGDPTVPLCNRAAVLHLVPLDFGKRASWTLYACELHADTALAGAVWDAHLVSPACSHRASVWVQGTGFRVSGCAMPREQAA